MNRNSGLFHCRSGLAACALFMMLTGTAAAGTLEDVRERDRLICGVSEGLPGFSNQDGSGAWQGFDVDFCKAVAAAVLGSADKIDYVGLSAEARFEALRTSKIDLLSRNSTWTMSRDTGLGIDFAGVSYFDGQGFLIQALYGMTSSLELEGAKICVVSGTTSEENAASYFAAQGMTVSFVRFPKRAAARQAYAARECDAYTADRSALAAERSLLPAPDDHVILRDVISKEPLGPVIRDDDPQWSDLVRWTLYGLINAEERELTAASVIGADNQAAITLGAAAADPLKLANDWLVSVISSVGNYGEIFDRNLGEDTPLALRRGFNAQWTRGGLLYAPPMQ